ncbi:MAG: SseB family protein [Sulfurimicrobium sp.]|jgi:hypothetical protein|nr:SseB family protein [Sulfurimicrobium sp.]MDP1705792.1 SseB family protein [Sulfurimicrobium sp.]MDP2199209.1 SseB family protein [Sulfurimicrobium sp.]MDP2962533.1 SseB family protein [Sulfurimicrobium sp.]MDP3689357.1 SseB family protein [Sulfurimicrobium sp.]
MSDQMFEPKNDLEQKLLAAANGELDVDDLIGGLLDDQVFMPVEDEESGIEGFQRSIHARPLVVQDEEGVHVLVLFSSPERAKVVMEEFPKFGGGLLADFRWVLEHIDAGAGVTINPGWDVGIDLDTETVAALSQQLAEEKGALQ